MSKPTVSVLVATYNRRHIVGNAIKSILNQSYPNKEIIVVDDCSTDDTENYFNKTWKGKVKYVRHRKNQGVQFASNTAFDHSKGEYVALIGDDDVWSDRNKLKKQVKIFEDDKKKRYGIVTSSVRIIRPDKSYIKSISKPKNIIKILMKGNGIIYGSAALIRREIFEQVGKFAEECPKGTDSDVFRRIVLSGYDVYFIRKPMVDVYEGKDRMTGKSEKSIVKSIIGQNYNLRKYAHYLKMYPSSKSYRLMLLASHYEDLYKLKNNDNCLITARRLYLESLKTHPLSYISLYKLTKSYFLQIK